MFYENHLRQLIRLRTDYWQLETVSQRNLKLSQMVLCANACGKDLIDFVLEAKSENTEAFENQPIENTKAILHLRKYEPEKAKSDSYLRKSIAFTKIYGCTFCDFTTHSPNALSGHMKRHSSKYQSLDIAV